MSFKKIFTAALVAAPFALVSISAHAGDADKGKEIERIDYMKQAIDHLMEIRKGLVEDMKKAKTEEEALEAAKNIGHITDAVTTIHAVEHMHDMHKSDK